MCGPVSEAAAHPLLDSLAGAPTDPSRRYAWFIESMGILAKQEPQVAAFLVDRRRDHPHLRQLRAARPDLTTAVLQAAAFIDGRTDLLNGELRIDDEESMTPPESLDVLARLRASAGNLSGAIGCYRRIERAVSPPVYTASRLAALAFCAGHREEANALYARMLSCASPHLRQALANLGPVAESYAAVVRDGQESFAANESYWADKAHVHDLIRTYEQDLTGGWGYRTPGRQINFAALRTLEETFLNTGAPAAVLNVGSFCGAIDLERARKHPAVSWIGYDRESLAIEYSREHYRHGSLAFLDGAFEDALAYVRETYGGARRALIHSRSTSEMPPAKIARLYRDAAKSGIDVIVGAEFIGVDILTRRYFDPDGEHKTSSAVTQQIANHDYRQLLADAGYRVIVMRDEPIIAFYEPLPSFEMLAYVTTTVIRSFAAERMS